MIVLVGSLVMPDHIVQGWAMINNGLIAELGYGAPPRGESVVDATGSFILPGLVDIHCHGGGGSSFSASEPSARAAARFHWSAGTTSIMASLGTDSPAAMATQVAALAPVVADGTTVGIHLEGPFLSVDRRGAHPQHDLRAPDIDELARLVTASGDQIAMVTLAPELPGAMDALAWLRKRKIVVAVGHTDATFAVAAAAFAAGATVATHLFNGMRPIHHREGGPVPAALRNVEVTSELICDGHHVSADMCRFVYDSVGVDRLALVTDACSPAGMPDGEYMVGPERVVMSGGEIRTADGRSLAGSVLTLMAAVRFALSCGIPMVDAVRSASLTPARALGLHDRGALATGTRADVVVADAALNPIRVMRGGVWI